MKFFNWFGILIVALATFIGCGGSPAETVAEEVTPPTQEIDPAMVLAGGGESFFVSPASRAEATGTAEDPWSLAHALDQPPQIRPGDTIWLLDGVYQGTFSSSLTGEPDKPILVRAYPGHRVVIDSGAESASPALAISGADTWYWGLEILSSHANRSSPDPRTPERIDRATGVHVGGPRVRLINSVIHDMARGVMMTTEAVDSEAYGNLIYYCGWASDKRGYGSALRAHNAEGAKRLEENIQFAGFENGFQLMGDTVQGVRLRGNISFNSGLLFENQRTVNFLVSAARAGARDVLFEQNHSYFPLDQPGGVSNLGWVYGGAEQSVEATGNYWVGGMTPIEVWNWANVRFAGNVLAAQPGRLQVALTRPDQAPPPYDWDGNRYFGSQFFRLDGAKVGWEDWKAQTSFDQTGEWTSDGPHGVWTVIRPNRYEPGRGHVIVYNWDRADSVEVDLSEVLREGAEYELRDVQDFHGEPLAAGLYEGGSVTLRLPETASAAQPVGLSAPPAHSGPVFWVLVALSAPELPALSEARFEN